MLKPCLPILITVIFCSCREHKKNINQIYVQSEKAEITSLVVSTALVSDTSFKKFLIDGYPIDDMTWDTDEEKEKFLKRRKYESDSLTTQLDTAKIYVLLADTLLNIGANYLKSKLLDTNGNTIDSLKNGIKDRWASEIRLDQKFEKFDMKNLNFIHNYRYLLHSNFRPSGGVEFFAGNLRLSPIYFNQNKDKAFVYVERLNHKGFDIYLEKRNGKWFIIKRDLAWIS